MGVKGNLLLRLLPGEAREHVLGDLEETGFRWRDCVSAFAGAWRAHCRRELLGPVPQLANAPENLIRQRIAQLSGPDFGWNLYWFFAVARFSYAWLGLTGLIPAMLMALLLGNSNPLPVSSPDRSALMIYRSRLILRILSLIWVPIYSALFLAVSREIGLGVLLLAAVFVLYRGSRLVKEWWVLPRVWQTGYVR